MTDELFLVLLAFAALIVPLTMTGVVIRRMARNRQTRRHRPKSFSSAQQQ